MRSCRSGGGPLVLLRKGSAFRPVDGLLPEASAPLSEAIRACSSVASPRVQGVIAMGGAFPQGRVERRTAPY